MFDIYKGGGILGHGMDTKWNVDELCLTFIRWVRILGHGKDTIWNVDELCLSFIMWGRILGKG